MEDNENLLGLLDSCHDLGKWTLTELLREGEWSRLVETILHYRSFFGRKQGMMIIYKENSGMLTLNLGGN